MQNIPAISGVQNIARHFDFSPSLFIRILLPDKGTSSNISGNDIERTEKMSIDCPDFFNRQHRPLNPPKSILTEKKPPSRRKALRYFSGSYVPLLIVTFGSSFFQRKINPLLLIVLCLLFPNGAAFISASNHRSPTAEDDQMIIRNLLLKRFGLEELRTQISTSSLGVEEATLPNYIWDIYRRHSNGELRFETIRHYLPTSAYTAAENRLVLTYNLSTFGRDPENVRVFAFCYNGGINALEIRVPI